MASHPSSGYHVPRHVFHGQLWGRACGLAADDGHDNVWEESCLHRGVLPRSRQSRHRADVPVSRLVNANRTAGCTNIPAHRPMRPPARTICNRVYPVRSSVAWSGLPSTGTPSRGHPDAAEWRPRAPPAAPRCAARRSRQPRRLLRRCPRPLPVSGGCRRSVIRGILA
jgi:hypothetical protein